MNAISVWQGIGLCAGFLALSIGCGDSGPKRPKTYPVRGTVTYNGEPVVDANLNFQLAVGSGNAFAKTDSEGKYELMTFEHGDGAVPGDYRVSITKYESPPPPPARPSMAGYVPPPRRAAAFSKNLLPRKYSNAAHSGLTAKVVAGRNTFDFVLAD
jgi:hypothetical protein